MSKLSAQSMIKFVLYYAQMTSVYYRSQEYFTPHHTFSIKMPNSQRI